MKQSVILKSNQSGITLVLDKDVPFEQLLNETVKVFNENNDFFQNSRFAIAFSGRELTEDEEVKMVLTINQNTKANVIRIISHDETMEEFFRQRQQEFDFMFSNNTGKFHKGTLKDKDVLEADTSIIILGDVLEGAKIISKGNIIVLGSLKGSVHAGVGGNNEAFVAAIDMAPSKLRISDLTYLPEDKKKLFSKRSDKEKHTQIAIIQRGRIEVSPLISNK